jgi:transcriptional regulator with XRE-family HTH domain
MAPVAEEQSVDEIAARLGRALRKAREDAGVTQSDLARRLETTPNQVSRWEAGGRRLDLEVVEEAEMAMGLTSGTVLRLAGFVSDGQLVDLGALPNGARRSVRAILREWGLGEDRERPAEGVDGNGVDGPEG